MQDHSDDCQIVLSNVCTCTTELGQPAAQLNRKRLIDEYQRGVAAGHRAGREEAIAEMVAMAGRTTAVPPEGYAPDVPVTGMPAYIQQAPKKVQESWVALSADKSLPLRTGPLQIPEGPAVPASPVPATEHWHDYSTDDLRTLLHIPDQPEVRDWGIPIGWWALITALAFGAGLIAAAVTWFFGIPHPFLWSIGAAVVMFCGVTIKLDIDLREKARRERNVHRTR
jgi:hypothetical protein